MNIGDQAPGFSLPDTDGQEHGPDGVTAVIFTCNHCPYALGWHDRLLQLARDYDDVTFLAINPNDADRYPADSYEAMRERVQTDGGWPMPYLRDESQEVARAYDAKTTPDVFLLDADLRLRYRGAPDRDYRDGSLRADWVRDALDAVTSGADPQRPETEPVGCSIKWR
jgi:hypothetical protein